MYNTSSKRMPLDSNAALGGAATRTRGGLARFSGATNVDCNSNITTSSNSNRNNNNSNSDSFLGLPVLRKGAAFGRRSEKGHRRSYTRFPLSRFSPGAGLLRNPFLLHYQR